MSEEAPSCSVCHSTKVPVLPMGVRGLVGSEWVCPKCQSYRLPKEPTTLRGLEQEDRIHPMFGRMKPGDHFRW